MSNLYKNIASLCEEKGIKGAKLCNDIGISKGILTDLKMGRRTGVNAVTAQKIASYFGVSVGYLLGEEKEKKPDIKYIMEGNNMSMAENIRRLRIQHKMTQEELGSVLGVQKSAIRKYESGMVENIPRSSIQKMAKLFNVRPSYLMGFEEEPADERLAEFINLFTKLPPEQQDFVILQIKGVLSNKKI